MSLVQALHAEYSHEVISLRKALERVPNDKMNWTPHAKSMTIGALASHLAVSPTWGVVTIKETEFDWNPSMKEWRGNNAAEIVAKMDENVAAFLSALKGTTDDHLAVMWSFKVMGQPVFTDSRAGVLRGMVFSHLIHHRAQLGVYLRLLDVPVPSMYGPSADEQG